jgi:penicillin-binding protein 2
LKVDARGNLIDEPKVLIYQNPANIRTYLDLDLYRLVDSLMKPYGRGAAFAFNPKTGEIYLVYSKPGPYDTASAKDSPLLNRAIAGLYPPGSTFKPLVALLALKYGVIDTTFGVGCRGYVWLGRRKFRCWSIHGYTRLRKAIAWSCNVFFYNVGSRFGPRRFVKAVWDTGLFGRRLTPLPEEVPSRFPKKARYYGSVLNYAIGQGEILVTPVFLSVEAGLIGNGGWVTLPRFSPLDRPETLRVEAPKWMYEKVKEGMLGVVEEGTAAASRLPGFRYGGKTGTAQNPHGEDHSLFIAFAPYDDPTFAVAVVVENAGHGSSAAAPIASMLIRKRFGIEGLPPYYAWRVNASRKPTVDTAARRKILEELDLEGDM